MDHLERHVLKAGELAQMVERIATREVDPYTAAADLLSRALNSPTRQFTHSPTS
jgi:hypothetical protein